MRISPSKHRRSLRALLTLLLTGLGAAALAGQALAAGGVSLSPTSIAFGAQSVGTTSAVHTVTITSTGTTTLSISAIVVSGADFARSTTTCGARLARRASCTVGVVFSPTAAVARSGSLTITDNAPGGSQTVALTGTGAGSAAATAAPSSLSFGSTVVGSSSAAQSVTLTNTGTASLSISKIALGSASGSDFRLGASTCAASLAAGASCTQAVTFLPGSAGAKTDVLSFTDTAAGSPQTVALSGTGAAAATTATLAPTTLAFPSTAVGTSSSPSSVTLTNTGSAPLTISSIALTAGTDFRLGATTCAATLAAGTSCTQAVTFLPASAGAKTDTLTFVDNATGSPQTVALSGTATTAAALSVTPATGAFGTVTVATTSAPIAFTVTNGGGSATGSLTTTVSGTGFAVTTDGCAGTSLAAGATCVVSVALTAASAVTYAGTLVVAASPGGQATATLAGVGGATSAGCPLGTSVYTVAHEDDSILFESPDLAHEITRGRCVETIFLTAGDAGAGLAYAQNRELGAEAAYANMAGVASTWTTRDAGVAGHPLSLVTLTGNPKVTLVFMRLPDGGSGTGFAATGNQSLQELLQGTIGTIRAIDGSSSYTKDTLTSTLTGLFLAANPDRIATQDFVGTYGDGDHSDHHAAAYLTVAAGAADPTPHTVVGYEDYAIANLPVNLSAADITVKQNAWFAYGPYDPGSCLTVQACNGTSTGAWLQRQYVAGTLQQPATQVGGGTNAAPLATVTASSETAATGQTAAKAVDGVADGYPGDYTKEWASAGQGAGAWLKLTWSAPQALGSIVLNDRPNTSDQVTGGTIAFSDGSTLTVPALPDDGSPLTLTFATKTVTSLTFTVTSVSSSTANVGLAEIQAVTAGGTVTPPPPPPPGGTNVALQASATASSETAATGQTAAKAIDGSALGYPVDYTHEWATSGKGVGATLTLTWSTPQTVTSVVLNDRPNLDDQVTGGTITFSDGTTLTVPALPNDGTALKLTFPAKTITKLVFTVGSVSATTANAGLAELSVLT